jgi:diadenosine tetraphosphate (Ap4A) HIT family hydrolase
MDETLIFETGHFRVEHCRDCGVAGYLIVSPRKAVPSLGAMAPEALADLGAVLARATAAIEAVLLPGRVYCALFGEEVRDVHFHVFPRTDALLAEYRRSTANGNAACSGPLILDWARWRFRRDGGEPLDGECRRAAEALRRSASEE